MMHHSFTDNNKPREVDTGEMAGMCPVLMLDSPGFHRQVTEPSSRAVWLSTDSSSTKLAVEI
jgi:hypothetical protein